MAKQISKNPESIRQRLRNLLAAPEQFDRILETFAFERLLYRLSVSPYRDRFMLKGGMLVMHWVPSMGRFTRDVDLHAFGSNEESALREVFGEILSKEIEDGLIFDVANIGSIPILKDDVCGGTRLKTKAMLGNSIFPIKIDLGFGRGPLDSNYEISYNSLLDFPPAILRAYSPAYVIAEKFHTMVTLGLINSRIKDFFDLAILPKTIEITPEDLEQAIRTTFERRETEIPNSRPEGLSEFIGKDQMRMEQWKKYVKHTKLAGSELNVIVDDIWSWIAPICSMALESAAKSKGADHFPNSAPR